MNYFIQAMLNIGKVVKAGRKAIKSRKLKPSPDAFNIDSLKEFKKEQKTRSWKSSFNNSWNKLTRRERIAKASSNTIEATDAITETSSIISKGDITKAVNILTDDSKQREIVRRAGLHDLDKQMRKNIRTEKSPKAPTRTRKKQSKAQLNEDWESFRKSKEWEYLQENWDKINEAYNAARASQDGYSFNKDKVEEAYGVNQPDEVGTSKSLFFKLNKWERAELYRRYNSGELIPYYESSFEEYGIVNFI